MGAAGGLLLAPPTVREIHSLEMAWTSGEIERRGDRGRGRGEVVSRLRMGFFGGQGRVSGGIIGNNKEEGGKGEVKR